ncbi:hypothetical protein D7W79_23990 [Corallococcus exercitus]|nr:hypothetical protein D7W79_23990 [Corallococcus exercitus]
MHRWRAGLFSGVRQTVVMTGGVVVVKKSVNFATQ